MECQTPRDGLRQNPLVTRKEAKTPRHQRQRMVEHRRTENKHNPNEAQTRILDPHPAPLSCTSHPHQHVPSSPTIPRSQKQQGRMHSRPHWPRKRLLERDGSGETQIIPIPRHASSRRRIQPRSNHDHGIRFLHPKRTSLGHKRTPQSRQNITTRIQIL